MFAALVRVAPHDQDRGDSATIGGTAVRVYRRPGVVCPAAITPNVTLDCDEVDESPKALAWRQRDLSLAEGRPRGFVARLRAWEHRKQRFTSSSAQQEHHAQKTWRNPTAPIVTPWGYAGAQQIRGSRSRNPP